jgi:hypothetical protein
VGPVAAYWVTLNAPPAFHKGWSGRLMACVRPGFFRFKNKIKELHKANSKVLSHLVMHVQPQIVKSGADQGGAEKVSYVYNLSTATPA